jgi:hypothetical protein
MEQAVEVRRPEGVCRHVVAHMVGPLRGKRMPDGRWRYTAAYACPCGHRFTESYIRPY